MRPSQDMNRPPHSILILFCTLFIAADEPQQPSRDTHERVAKAYYAQVQKAAVERDKAAKRDFKAVWSDTPPTPKQATGVVVGRQGNAIPGAGVVIKAGDAVLGEGTTNATGGFQIMLSTQSYAGLTLTVTKNGFNRWARGGIYGGIVGYWVRLDREIDDGFLKNLNDEKNQERRLWKLLEIVGDRHDPTKKQDLFPHIGTLRDDLIQLVQSKAFEAKDGRRSSPADRACSLLAYWHDPADESMFMGWLKNQKHIKHPMDKKMAGKTIPEVCKQWADRHFDNKKPEDRTLNSFSKPLLDPSGNHALVQFWVTYKHWGYSQVLVLTKQLGEWELKFVADDQHWHGVTES